MNLCIFLLVVVSFLICYCDGQINTNATIRSPEKQRQWLLGQLMGPSYEEQIRPFANSSQPVVVEVQYELNLLYNIDSRQETWSVDLFIRERWFDPRLQFDSSLWPIQYGILKLTVSSAKPWRPDTFLYNSLTCRASGDEQLVLDPSGQLTWYRHQRCDCHSPFSLAGFPFDAQIFPLKRQSFGYDQNNMVLVNPSDTCFNPDPVVDFENSLWQLDSYSCTNESFAFHPSLPSYSVAVARLHVSRLTTAYWLKLILPMFLIVLVSSLTYWIDPKSAPARVAGSVTLVLSMVTFNLLVSQDIPKINYSTLLDWYVWKCFLFTIFAVAEFALVNNIIVGKRVDEKIGYAIDDWCSLTVPVTWVFANLMYWPSILGGNDSGIAFISLLMVLWIIANVYRVMWNVKNGKTRFAAWIHMWHEFKAKFCVRRPPSHQGRMELDSDDEEEDESEQEEQQPKPKVVSPKTRVQSPTSK